MSNVATEPEAVQDYDLRDGLFSDLLEGLTKIPPIPDDVRPYDVAITRAEARDEGKKVFLLWLREQLGIRDDGAWRSARLACSEDPELFVLNWPEPEDYALGYDDLEYMRADRLATINQAKARRVCDDCPVRSMCLARNITHWRAGYASASPIDTGVDDPETVSATVSRSKGTIKIIRSEDQVVGGWGLLARTTIANRYTELRRAFEGGIREEKGETKIGAGRMNASERERYVEEARTFQIREW